MANPEILEQLVEEGLIDDVKDRLMSGKEASVFIVERRGELLAAKVYKERDERTFRSTAAYTEGRNQTRNSRDRRAMGKRSRYGKELIEESWRDMEYRALSDAFHAGVRVPEPVLLYENVLLMELLVDEDGRPAPRLADFDLPPEVAELLHREVYGQVRLLLQSGRVHGDLSAFNVLVAHHGLTMIDFPQVIDAAANRQAADILRRDLRNVTEHLARFDARLLRFRDCGEPLWQHFVRGTLDSAVEPEQAFTRGERPGRRDRDAERGRFGRGRGHDRPADRPADRPSDRPSDRPADRPADRSRHEDRSPNRADRPRHEQGHSQHGQNQSHNQSNRGDRPRADDRSGDRPAQGRGPPQPRQQRQDQPRQDQPRQDQPRQDQPRQEQPPQGRSQQERGQAPPLGRVPDRPAPRDRRGPPSSSPAEPRARNEGPRSHAPALNDGSRPHPRPGPEPRRHPERPRREGPVVERVRTDRPPRPR